MGDVQPFLLVLGAVLWFYAVLSVVMELFCGVELAAGLAEEYLFQGLDFVGGVVVLRTGLREGDVSYYVGVVLYFFKLVVVKLWSV